MKRLRLFLSRRMNRVDWIIILVYWAVVIPIVVCSAKTMEVPPADREIAQSVMVTVFLDTTIVLMVVFLMPYLISGGVKHAVVSGMLAIVVLFLFGTIYMVFYSRLYYGTYMITLATMTAGIVQQGRSYVPLLIVLTVRAVYRFGQEMATAKLESLGQQVLRLRSFIAPHFLVNALEVPVDTMGADELRVHVKNIRRLMHYNIYDCQQSWIDVTDEVLFLKDYVSHEEQHLFYPDIVDMRISGVKPGMKISPGILVQFVQNAFKYSAKGKEDRITIDFEVRKDILYFCVENTYSGGGPQSKAGWGLNGAKRLLDFHYDDYELLISPEANLFRVELSLTLLSDAQLN